MIACGSTVLRSQSNQNVGVVVASSGSPNAPSTLVRSSGLFKPSHPANERLMTMQHQKPDERRKAKRLLELHAS